VFCVKTSRDEKDERQKIMLPGAEGARLSEQQFGWHEDPRDLAHSEFAVAIAAQRAALRGIFWTNLD
jgi:hypothetical protein